VVKVDLAPQGDSYVMQIISINYVLAKIFDYIAAKDSTSEEVVTVTEQDLMCLAWSVIQHLILNGYDLELSRPVNQNGRIPEVIPVIRRFIQSSIISVTEDWDKGNEIKFIIKDKIAIIDIVNRFEEHSGHKGRAKELVQSVLDSQLLGLI
jgi:hypothetical protein